MKLVGTQVLTKSRDRLRELSTAVAKQVGALRVERAALPLTARVFQDQHRRAIEQKARDTALTAWKKASEEAQGLTGPLAALRDLEREADRRRITREEVLTERWLRDARHVPAYTPKEYTFNPADHRPLYADPIVNELRNQREQDRAERADLANALAELRMAITLPKLPAAELAARATDAAERGDGATLAAIWREHESRSYSTDEARTSVALAVRRGIQAIPLPEDTTAELALLDEIANAERELRAQRDLIDGNELPAAAKARMIGDLGEQGFMDRQRQDADELRTAAQKRAEQLVRTGAAELVGTANNAA